MMLIAFLTVGIMAAIAVAVRLAHAARHVAAILREEVRR